MQNKFVGLIMQKKVLNILSAIVVIVCLFYVIKTTISLDIDYALIYNVSVLYSFLLSSGILVANIFFAAYIYKRNIDIISGESVSYGIISTVYIKAGIGKYLPGNVMHFAGRNIIGFKYGLCQKVLFSSTVLLQGQVMIVALLLSVALSFEVIKETFNFILQNQHSYFVISIMVIIAIIAVLLLFFSLKYIKSGKYVISFFTTRNAIDLFITFFATAAYLVFYAVSFIVTCYAFTTDMSLSNFTIIIAAFITAWVIGTIIPGAPGGLGVRESVLVLILANIIATEILMLILIVHRLSTIFADVVAYIIITIRDISKQIIVEQGDLK